MSPKICHQKYVIKKYTKYWHTTAWWSCHLLTPGSPRVVTGVIETTYPATSCCPRSRRTIRGWARVGGIEHSSIVQLLDIAGSVPQSRPVCHCRRVPRTYTWLQSLPQALSEGRLSRVWVPLRFLVLRLLSQPTHSRQLTQHSSQLVCVHSCYSIHQIRVHLQLKS